MLYSVVCKIVKGHSSRSALFFLYSVRMVSTKYKGTNESLGVLGEKPMLSPKRIQRLQGYNKNFFPIVCLKAYHFVREDFGFHIFPKHYRLVLIMQSDTKVRQPYNFIFVNCENMYIDSPLLLTILKLILILAIKPTIYYITLLYL